MMKCNRCKIKRLTKEISRITIKEWSAFICEKCLDETIAFLDQLPETTVKEGGER